MNADLRSRILAEVRAAPSPTRSMHRTRVASIVALGTLVTAGLFFAMGGLAWGARSTELVVLGAGVALVVAVFLTRLSATSRRSMLPRSRGALVAASALAAAVLTASALVGAWLSPEAAHEPVSSGVDLACGAMTVAQGAVPLLLLLLPRRGGDPVHPVITGAALGMTAGAWAATLAYLRCPHAAASHGILAHVAPVLLFAAAGAVLGHAMLRIR
jgi:hypothetical protein